MKKYYLFLRSLQLAKGRFFILGKCKQLCYLLTEITLHVNVSRIFLFLPTLHSGAVPLRAAAENSQSKGETEVTKLFFSSVVLFRYFYPV